jgi:hypothetical protein
MRTPALALAALLLLAPSASAAPATIADPKGDALLASFDLVSVRFSADVSAQRIALTFADADPSSSGRFAVTTATPSCDAVTMEWTTGADSLYLAGCAPRQRAWFAPPVWTGNTLTMSVPRRAMPSWWRPGTTVHDLSVTVGPSVDVLMAGALQPPSDDASGDGTYVLGT